MNQSYLIYGLYVLFSVLLSSLLFLIAWNEVVVKKMSTNPNMRKIHYGDALMVVITISTFVPISSMCLKACRN